MSMFPGILETVIFINPLTPSNTPPALRPHPNCQSTYTGDPTEHSPAVEDPYCPVTVLLAIGIRCFVLLMCFQILTKMLEILHFSFDSQENL